jgi:transcriptional regulator with XRE-family HTH domain
MKFTDTEKYMDNKIKQIRRAKGLTQLELGERIGKTQTYIARLEAGRTSVYNMTVQNARLIADALGCTIDDFFLEGKEPKSVTRQYTAEEVYSILKQWDDAHSHGTPEDAEACEVSCEMNS